MSDKIIIGNPPSPEELAAIEAAASLVLIQGAPPAVPEHVLMGQARCALGAAGMYDAVATLIATLPETHFTRILWEYAPRIARHGKHMDIMQPALGWTDEQIDELFIAAALID